MRQRQDVVSRLLWELKDHGATTKFPRGVLMAVAPGFRVSQDTIRRVWKRAVENCNDPDVQQFCASPPKINNCGRPQKWNRDEIREAVKEVPIYQKKTIRSFASALNVPKSTLFRMKDERGNDAVILPVSIAAKPLLTEEHKSQRVFYSCENVNFVDSTFNDCFSSIHIDEKWFFISEKHSNVHYPC